MIKFYHKEYVLDVLNKVFLSVFGVTAAEEEFSWDISWDTEGTKGCGITRVITAEVIKFSMCSFIGK